MIVKPFFADGIDLPLVALFGIAIIVPLMLFQIAVEGGILCCAWRIPFKQLVRPVFLANCWSLVAGIPVKILNATIYSYLLPYDLAGYFARYPLAITVGTLVFLVVTILVEAVSLSRWLKREFLVRTRARIWLGVLVANIATYAVLGPLHYLGTRPVHDVKEFSTDTAWAKQPPTQIVYIDSESGHLKSIYSDGSKPATLVPQAVKDYLVTSNLDLVLFHDQQGVRWLYRTDTNQREQGDAEHAKLLNTQPIFGSEGKEDWGGNDSFKDWKAWAVPGLGNQIRVYRTNDRPNSLVRMVVNPGLLHISDFRFRLSHPAFISDGSECLFQSRDAIYLLDIEYRRVGKITNGRNFILLTPAYAKTP
jgi:hypothetical protein